MEHNHFWIYVLLIALVLQLGVAIDLIRKIPGVKERLDAEKQQRRNKRMKSV